MEEKKKKVGFNIIKNDSTDGHGGFGVGALSLNNVSPVIIDVEAGTASIEIGAMHARSDLEKGIKFLMNKAEVPNGKPYWLIWVTIDRKPEGPYYAGMTACEMTVDREIRRGYKSLPEHVNNLDKSIKRKMIVDHMDQHSKKVLGEFLKNHNVEIWNNSSSELKNLLGVD